MSRGHEVRAEMAQGRERTVPALHCEEPTITTACHVLEKHPLDRIARAELEHLVECGLDERLHPAILASGWPSSREFGPVIADRLYYSPAAMPIHVRAESGDYAEAVLLPGDPLRAKYIAETYFDDPVQRNRERGLLGYTGTWKDRPVSVQGTGMGCPGATIVFEELVQLGCKKLIRVGTCGGLQQAMRSAT